MGWTDMMKEGLRKVMETDIGRELAQKARAKAGKGLDSILGGSPEEGEKRSDEAKRDARTAADTGDQQPTDDQETPDRPRPTEH